MKRTDMTAPSRSDVASLDAQITRAEQRLLDHEARLRQHLRGLNRRVREAAAPRQWALPALAGVAALLLWRSLRRGPRVPHVDGATRAVAPQPPRMGIAFWLTQLSSLLWPLLAAQWRARAPAGAAALLTAARRHDAGLPRPVAHVDLNRYAGTWYEVARLRNRFEARCAGQPSATYRLAGGYIEVINRCPARDGERVVHGVARVERGSGGARLAVSFAPRWLRALPFAWADYWVLHLEPDYSAALVGTPGRRHLWLL
jgi:apolipoprotein D and lipocalin family protein